MRVHGAGSQYIELQQQLRAGTPEAELDMSMVEVMRRGMTDDEKLIDKMIGEHEILSRELDLQKKADAQAAGEGDTDNTNIRERMSRGEQVLVGGDSGVEAATVSPGAEGVAVESEGEDAAAGGVGEDSTHNEVVGSALDATDEGEDGSGDDLEEEEEEVVPEGPPPEGFARRGRELSMKRGPTE